jgi:histidinol-phosphate aminotransferase
MTQTLRPQPGILDIALYVGGDSRLEGHDEVLKLSSNENPHGPSPRAIEAFREAAGDLHRYPSTDHRRLREAIGAVHGLDPDRIVCGVGSDEVLQMVTQAYAGPRDDEIILTEHGFSMYPILAKMVGAVPVTVPERERTVDVDAILGAVTGGRVSSSSRIRPIPPARCSAETILRGWRPDCPRHVILDP